MNYETIKSFILVVLVGISLLLSFILWSYQPSYESSYDTSYVNEVDVGGVEKTKNELVEPIEIIFKNGDTSRTFINPLDRRNLYQAISSWTLYDYQITKAQDIPRDKQQVEIIYPTTVPAELITNLFSFDQDFNPPDWSFERVDFILDDEKKSIQMRILSTNGEIQLTATIEKTDTFNALQDFFGNKNDLLEENLLFGNEENAIYIPKGKVSLNKKTLIASKINPKLFIDALFRNPSLVTQNFGEAYFTDGQRGMRIFQEGLRLEFINPIQANYERLSAYDLIEKSVERINEHRGWTNNYMFDSINRAKNSISFRLSYDGLPVFDNSKLSIIEQEWRDQELYEYHRPLILVDNLLNSDEVILPSGESIKKLIQSNQDQFNIDDITDIRIGYYLTYNDGAHSLTLEPSWFIIYKNDWMRLNAEEYRNEDHGGGVD